MRRIVLDRGHRDGPSWSLATALVLLGLVFAGGIAWFPPGQGGIADAAREAGRLEREEEGRASPEGALS